MHLGKMLGIQLGIPTLNSKKFQLQTFSHIFYTYYILVIQNLVFEKIRNM